MPAPGATASISAPTANSTPALTAVQRRPMRSAVPPATSAPKSAPSVTQLVTISLSIVERSRSLWSSGSAPEMTPWS
jgi:hypothetical protein